MTEIVVADIGGTHARFARVSLRADGEIDPTEPMVLNTHDYAGLTEAWRAYHERIGGQAPEGAALALAGPVGSAPFKLTNAQWTFDRETLASDLGVERLTLLNDFAAVAHAVATAREDDLAHVAGPDRALPEAGTVTVIGPGTGLGVAHFHRHGSDYHVQATEGAHIDFAPVDALDDALLARLRRKYPRVSLERVLSGAGIVAIHAEIAKRRSAEIRIEDERAIWRAGLAREDALAEAAVAHFVKTLGRAAGDYALAHGASAVVLAGGLGQRVREQLREPAFHEAFLDKGRYRKMMAAMSIKLIVHPQPGLLGAAAAFAREHL